MEMNKNDKLFVIFLSIGLFAVIAGGALIYGILNPAPPIETIKVLGIPIKEGIPSLMLIFLSLSWLIHGFQVRLLA